MSKHQPTEKPTTPATTGEPKTWLRVADGIWQRSPSGIYYERPTIDLIPTYRSLKTRDFDEAQKEYYRRRAQGSAAYQKVLMTTVGEVILNYREAGCPDRFRDERPADTKAAEETNCDNLLEFWEDIPVAIVSVAVFDRYCDTRKKTITKKGCSGNRTVDLELNTLRNAFLWACRCELIPQIPLSGRWPRYHSSKKVKHCREFKPHDAAELHRIAQRLFEWARSEVLGWQVLFEANTGLRTVETLRLRFDAEPYEPGWVTPDGKSLCVRRAKGQESVNPFVRIHEGLSSVLAAMRRWHKERWPNSPWYFPSPMDPSKPIDKSALCHALRRLRKSSKGPDGAILDGFLKRKITSHGMRAWYVTVRRSHGIPDNQIAWEIGHTSGGQTLAEVYGGAPPHWLAGDGPKLRWSPDGDQAWSALKYSTPEVQLRSNLAWLARIPAVGRFHSSSFSARLCLEALVRLIAPQGSMAVAGGRCIGWEIPAPKRLACAGGRI
jgi:hypothetical protein